MALLNRLLGLMALCLSAVLVHAASLQQITSFGANPSGAKMFIYVPDNVAPRPAILAAVHHCQGTAQSYFGSTPYRQLADRHGFIVVYPESPYQGTCWDVSSPATLRYEGGGNSNAIANMVKWALQRHNGDPAKVYLQGASSGAMMANVLAATYPDLFQAAVVYAGVPAGCFYTGSVAGWNSTCAQGNSIASQQTWAGIARAMRPGYTGNRPRMQIYHGGVDDIVRPRNYNETIKQWSGVLGYPEKPVSVTPGVPSSEASKEVYGDKLHGFYFPQRGHNVPIFGEEDLKWFGIIGGSSPPTPPPTQNPPTTPPPSGNCAAKWGQCGGQGWAGPTCCVSGSTCQVSNAWYSQCL